MRAVLDNRGNMNALTAPIKEEKPAPIDNSELVKKFREEGGQIIHIRPHRYVSGRVSRGVTVAFRVKKSRVEIATAVQHRDDDFTKKIGTKTAIEHFNAGKTIFLPIINDRNVARLLDRLLVNFCD